MIDVDMTFKTSAHLALLNYSQADEDGVMVLVSRQAIHEVSAEITRIRARLAEAEAVIKPFAEEAIRYAPDEGDGDDVLWDKTGWLRIKHLRAAARWMEGKQ